jgi:recombinational DNA repair ATPase RecF
MSTLVLACLVVYLAKINVFHVKHGYKPTLLIDDLFFGIDDKNLNTVIKLLVNSKGSFIVSSPSIYEEMLDKVVQENKQITVLNIGDR